MTNLNVKIVCQDDKYLPTYATPLDACMDLKVRVAGAIQLLPGEEAVLGTGVQVSVPKNHVMLVFPRSSTGIKLHCRLANTVGVIDSGYRDEVKLAIRNSGTETLTIKDGDRLAQFLIIERPSLHLLQVEDNEDFRNGDRGGGIGSTGK